MHYLADHCSRPRHQLRNVVWQAKQSAGSSDGAGDQQGNGGDQQSNGGDQQGNGGDQQVVVAMADPENKLDCRTCKGYGVGSGKTKVDGVSTSAHNWIILCLMASKPTKTSAARNGSFVARDFILYVYAPSCKEDRASSGMFKFRMINLPARPFAFM